MNTNEDFYHISTIFEQDLPSISQIENASYKYPWSKQSILNQINSQNAYNRSIYLDHNSSKLVGYIFGYTVLNDLYITNICIDPEFLKRKLASKLLKNLFNEAKSFNVNSIFLEVRKSNFAAKSLYKKSMAKIKIIVILHL